MKTKNRTFKAICVVLLIGFGIFQNSNFEIAQTKHNLIVELTQAKVQEAENIWTDMAVFAVKTTATAIKHLVQTL